MEKNEDAVRFYMKVLMAAWNKGFTLVCSKSRKKGGSCRVSSNPDSIKNPWSKRIDAKCPLISFCPWWCDAAAIEEQTVIRWRVLRKKKVFGRLSPIWCCSEWWSGLNRISHPDWVKICGDPNGQIKLRAKQKYEFLSATLLL